jgi:hypothetical protein
MTPGDTAFTRMLSLTSSFAMPRVNVLTKPFADAYIAAPAPPPLRAAIDVTLMMLPRPARRMCGVTAGRSPSRPSAR